MFINNLFSIVIKYNNLKHALIDVLVLRQFIIGQHIHVQRIGMIVFLGIGLTRSPKRIGADFFKEYLLLVIQRVLLIYGRIRLTSQLKTISCLFKHENKILWAIQKKKD